MTVLVTTWFRRVAILSLLAIFVVSGAAKAVGQGTVPATAPGWAAPGAMSIRKTSSLIGEQSESNFLSNIDCMLMTYRLSASNTMRAGCFTEAAFGMVDLDSGIVIFNGSDEGLPLRTYAGPEVLVPWPKALDLLTLDTAATGGSYLSLYKNPLAYLQDDRDVLGRLTGKHFTGPPDLPLQDADGHRLLINAQTLAFSNNGSWLVAESLYGSFLRINLATLDVLPFAKSFSAYGSPGMLQSQVSISNDGQFAAVGNEAAGSLKVYDLSTCASLQTGNCPSYDYRSFVHKQLPGLQYLRHLRFVNEHTLSFEGTSSASSESGSYLLAPQSSIGSLTDYIGLGDSYTSGEGAFDYRAGTDTDENHCHLSGVSYPLLLIQDVFSTAGGHSVACSGAEINDIGSTNNGYHGQVVHSFSYQELKLSHADLLASVMTNYLPGYVAQHQFVAAYQPRVLTVSVGGDDVGFGDILETCVMPHIRPPLKVGTCFNTYEDRLELINQINRTVSRWQALFKQLKAEDPVGTVFVVGYPDAISDTGSCALNVHLDQSEREFAKEMLAYINGGVAQAAQKAGVNYIDISQAFAGHRLCETAGYSVAMNGLTAGKDAGVFGINFLAKESYHPNALGQRLMEQEILKQSHNLAAGQPSAQPLPASADKLLDRPKTGRAVTIRMPASIADKKIVSAGNSLHIAADGPSHGLLPSHEYAVTTGDNGQHIGTLTSGADGSLDGEVTVPATEPPGGHTIDITGSNQDGEPVDITEPVYVSGSDDIDGDGIPNPIDSCPTASNSGQDDDRDGIDDACDGSIGQPPPVSGSSGSSNPPPQGIEPQSAQPQSETVELRASGLDSSGITAGLPLNYRRVKPIATLGGTKIPPKPGNETATQTYKLPGQIKISDAGQRIPHAKLRVIPWLLWSGVLLLVWWLIFLLAWVFNSARNSRPHPDYTVSNWMHSANA